MIFDSRFSWRHLYGWRTNLRVLLPIPFSKLIDKGDDCESHSAQHYWYNQDDRHSGCYYCKVVRLGRLWEQK